MVYQTLINFNKDETKANVRNRRGITYPVDIKENIPTTRAVAALERGWSVDALVRFYDGDPLIEGFLTTVPEIEVVTKEEVAQQKLEYETLGGDY